METFAQISNENLINFLAVLENNGIFDCTYTEGDFYTDVMAEFENEEERELAIDLSCEF